MCSKYKVWTHKVWQQIQKKSAAYPVETMDVLQASSGSAEWNGLIFGQRERSDETLFVFEVGRRVD